MELRLRLALLAGFAPLLAGCGGTTPPFLKWKPLGIDVVSGSPGAPPPPSVSVRRVGVPSLGSSTGTISVILDPRLGSAVGQLKDGGTVEIWFQAAAGDEWSGTYTFGSSETNALDTSMASHVEHTITVNVTKGSSPVLASTDLLKMTLTFTFEDTSGSPTVDRTLKWECTIEKW